MVWIIIPSRRSNVARSCGRGILVVRERGNRLISDSFLPSSVRQSVSQSINQSINWCHITGTSVSKFGAFFTLSIVNRILVVLVVVEQVDFLCGVVR